MKIGVGRLSLLFFMFVAPPGLTCAQVVFTEIMYDLPNGPDSGREWVEVYNEGTVPIAMSGWKLYENGTNHKMVPVAGGGTLAPGTYAVIADNAANFKADWPQFSGQLFDSAFSLSNSGETITLRDASSSDIDSISYQSSWGASGDGNSLNRAPGDTGAFIARRPSPGASMSSDAIIPPPPKPASVPKTKAVAKTSLPNATADSPVPEAGIVADIPDTAAAAETASAELAAAGSASPRSSPVWWGAAAALAAAAGGSLIAARRFGKKEWNIVEEKAE